MKKLFFVLLPIATLLIYFGCQEVPNDIDTGGRLYLLTPPAGSVCASGVVETVEAFNKDGSDILTARRILDNPLGPPVDNVFWSLGLSPSTTKYIILEFDQLYSGENILVYESTHSASYPLETVDVYVSSTSAPYNWDYLGEATNKGNTNDNRVWESSIPLNGENVKYVKIVETTDPNIHIGTADGFDVNAVCIENPGDPCTPLVTELWAGAGQNNTANGILVGNVTVETVGEFVNVTYNITVPDWFMTEAHVWIGTDPDDIPKNASPGKFPYKEEFEEPVTSWTFEIPWDVSGTCDEELLVAAHAVTINITEDYETVWQIGKVETDGCDGDLTNYANEFNWVNADGSIVGDCERGDGLSIIEPLFTSPFIVGSTPTNEFPYNSNFIRGYATDFDVEWVGDLPFGGKLTFSWSPGQSAYEMKKVINGGGFGEETFTATGTPSPGQGWFWNTYPLVENYIEVNPLTGGTHTINFQHTQGDGTFWDWIRLERLVIVEETAWGLGDETQTFIFNGISNKWGWFFDYTICCP